ncbi:bifunctional helix-turn-helix transcriptional regulator/GNAT family N-acetyltransferase [Rhodanobacter aciditrophus]|uniref:bifunctional helix-turn-helix transcriptional regulator/GNAT family N-acetyltransferase n=1 Tax=Rhodanobacter aciditrophus TaxID=1623218 RepID=UPI003CED5AB1
MVTDTLADLGVLFLGSRLKRLGDRLQTEASAILQKMDLPLQPAQQPLLAVLRREGPRTVGAIARHLRISQPTATRGLQALVEEGLISVSPTGRDGRHKLLSLTPAGAALMDRLEHGLWPRVETAAIAVCGGRHRELLEAIAEVETQLDHRSLTDRTLAPELTVRDFSDELAEAFYRINAEWIEEMFALEAHDIRLLSEPRKQIIDQGGAILFAETPDLGVVGTCAIMKSDGGWWELTKMGVSKAARGRGVGEFLLTKAIERSRTMGIADQLYLLTNRKCAAAVHLYEKLGFEHDPEVMRLFGSHYQRCDVAMRFHA